MLNKIIIEEYNPEWKSKFEEIKAMLFSIVGDLAISIEHVGSTSVEGLSSKPIIDIDIVMKSYEIFPKVKDRLENAGYKHEGNLGVEGREAFKRVFQDCFMTYHLYVCPKDGKGYLEHIAFRDYLRANEKARKDYEKLKIYLAEKYPLDRESYCIGKTEFVKAILTKAVKEA